MLRSEIRRLERRGVVRGWTRHKTATIAEKNATRVHYLGASE
jgi:hypothetical protein